MLQVVNSIKMEKYTLPGENNKSFTSQELVDFYVELCDKYPIISIEDGLDSR